MKLAILHDDSGQIIATSRVGDLKEAGSSFSQAGMVPRRGQRLVEVDAEGFDQVAAHQLHDEYEVDVQSSTLVKKKRP